MKMPPPRIQLPAPVEPVGNMTFVKRANKGAPRIFKNGEALMDAFTAYVKDCEDHPIIVEAQDAKGNIIEKRVPRVPSVERFSQHAGFLAKSFWSDWLDADRYPDLAPVCEQIKTILWSIRMEYGAGRVADPGMMSRLCRLAEPVENTISVAPPPPRHPPELIQEHAHPDMTEAQMMKILNAGLEIPTYSRKQIESGMPFHMPAIPEVIEHNAD